MKRSHVRTALALVMVSAFIALSVASSATLATPAGNQVVWRFAGEKNFEQQGTTIHDAGDVSGDGVRDVIVGLHTVETSASGNHIAARLYSGSDGGFLMKVNAPALQPHESFNPVASLGDLTGDGLSEFVVGTPGAQVGAYERAGVVRILSGTGTVLDTKQGSTTGAQFGTSVASAGDVNDDGLQDLIVGAPGAAEVYVYSGDQVGGFALLATLSAGLEPDDRFGGSVGTAGDINDDDRSEVVVGAPHFPAAGGHGGRVYVFEAEDGSDPIYTIEGSGPSDLLGADVDGGRDLNGDTVPDFVGSALGTDWTGPLGFGYVKTFSGADGTLLNTVTSTKAGDLFGFSAELSDPCDGMNPALIVGAPQAVNPGNSKITGRVVAYNAATGAQITEIYGESLLDGMGISVGGFVDLTSDGKAEFVVGAHGMSDPPALWTNGSGFVYSCVNIPRPNIVAVPNPAILGDVTVGTTQELVVQIQNQGDADLNISSRFLVAGSNPAFGFVAPPAPFTIPPAGSQPVTIQYSPTAMGIHGGTLQVQSNDPDSPTYDIILTGKGVQRTIQVTPASANFGPVDVGETSWAAIEAKNVGNAPLTVSSISLAPGSASEFTLGLLPNLPQSLAPSQKLSFPVIYEPTGQGAHSGTVEIASNDPNHPTTLVPLSGSGVPPNIPPTAVIKMDVPYTNGGNTIQFRGADSFDPDGTIDSYLWEFGHDGQTSTLMDPIHTFPSTGPHPRLHVVRLTVTDNGGKSDPTSVTAINWTRPLRSRFYGTIVQGGNDVKDGTVVEAWIGDVLVAESQTQTHLGQSVFAIEVPADLDSTGNGGTDGDTVVFKYKNSTANETGTWYRATDQELNLTAPYHLVAGHEDWCIHVIKYFYWICGPGNIIPEPEGMIIDLLEWPVPPIPDPGPMGRVGMAFELTMRDAASGDELTELPAPYEIRMSYTDGQLAAAGVTDESTLGMYFIDGSEWAPAGSNLLDPLANEMVTTLDHTSIFALMGVRSRWYTYLPIALKAR